MTTYIYMLNLQLFGEGGDGGAGAAPGDAGPSDGLQGSETGVQAPAAGENKRGKQNRFANVEFGIEEKPAKSAQQPAQAQSQSDDQADEKRFSQSDVNRILSNRLKNAHADKDRLDKLTPIVELLATKYGLEAGEDGSFDLDALSKAVTDDDEYYEDAAAERGMSVETYKMVHKLEQDAARREREDAQRLEETQRQAAFAKLVEQAQAAQQIYPSFDLDTEMQNPAFARLAAVGVDAKTAYEVIHKDEILGSGMMYAAQNAAQKISNAVRAGAVRPKEGGLGGNSPAQVRITDPTKLTPDQRKELRRRVRAGAKIVF